MGVTEELAAISDGDPRKLWLLQLAHQYLDSNIDDRRAVTAMAARELPAEFDTDEKERLFWRLVDAVFQFEYAQRLGWDSRKYCIPPVRYALGLVA